jgi:hypothetical protein
MTWLGESSQLAKTPESADGHRRRWLRTNGDCNGRGVSRSSAFLRPDPFSARHRGEVAAARRFSSDFIISLTSAPLEFLYTEAHT